MISQKYINGLFHFYAPFYFIVGNRFKVSRKLQANKLLNFTRELKLNNDRILIVGAGDGVDFPYYLDNYKEIVVVEASKNMVQMMKRKYQQTTNITIYHSDATEELPSNVKFDLVLYHFCLSITSDPKAIINSVSKNLKSRALISIIDVDQPVSKWAVKLFNWFTKYTMFDLRCDLTSLFRGYQLELLISEKLKELSLFKAKIYLKDD